MPRGRKAATSTKFFLPSAPVRVDSFFVVFDCTIVGNEEAANKSIASAKVAVAVFLQQVVGRPKVWPKSLGE